MREIKKKDINKFLRFEDKNNFENLVFFKKKVWPVVRYAVFYYLCNEKQYSYRYKAKKKLNLKKIIAIIYSFLSLKNIFSRCDILIYDYGRPQKIGKQTINPLKYSLAKSISKKFILSYVTKDYENTSNDQVNFYLIYKFFFIIYKLLFIIFGIRILEDKLNSKISDTYRRKINVNSILFDVFCHQLALGLIFEIIFFFKKPKIIFYSDNAEMSDVIYRAKKRKIITIDVQHSIISNINILYQHNKNNYYRNYLSDYVLTQSDYWKKFLSKSYTVKAVGSFLNDYYTNKYKKKKFVKNNITIISSIVSRKKLIRLTTYLSERFPKKKIIYKLRPEEYTNWRKYFPKDLYNRSNVYFVDNENDELYKILNNSKYVIGTNSTVLIQSLPFSKVIVLKSGWYNEMNTLIEDGYVKLAKNENEVFKIISGHKRNINRSNISLFKKNFSYNLKKFINSLDL